MELFSKRYKSHPDKFLEEQTRIRLQQEAKFIVSTNYYLERFLLVHHRDSDSYYLESDSLKLLSERELGYNITDYINVSDFTFSEKFFTDKNFFDLLELIVIFAKKKQRKEVVKRLNDILKEERSVYIMHDWMLVSAESSGLRSVLPFIKEKLLREKIEEYYHMNTSGGHSLNYQVSARIAADLVQYIFSSKKGSGHTKKAAENLCEQIAKKWTNTVNVENLSKLISTNVKNAKELSNQISNIRHTDKHTIPIDNPNFYKLVTINCMGIVELSILSLPEQFISADDPETLKSKYIERYNVKIGTEWYVPKKETDEIDVADIPF